MNIIDFESLKGGPLNILPYGEPGCGKTRFGLSVGEVLYTLFVDVDNGLKTALTVPPIWLKNIVPVQFTGFEDIDKIYKLLVHNNPEELNKAIYGLDKTKWKITKPFEAVVFDTWTEVNWNVKEYMRNNFLAKNPNRGTFKKTDKLEFRPNFEIQDWGTMIDFNQMCIEAFRDLPITFVCNMHEMFFEDKKGGRTSGTPSINGKFAAEIGKHFDIVGHMSVNITGDYIMDTAMKARFQAKTRIPLEKQIKNVTYKGILDAMKK